MMSAYAQFTTTGQPRRRSEKAAQNILFETRPPATTKTGGLDGSDTGFKGLLHNAVPKAQAAYTENFMTLADVLGHPLYAAAVHNLAAGATATVAGGGAGGAANLNVQTAYQPTDNYKRDVLRRAFSRHNARVASGFDDLEATAARFGEIRAPVADTVNVRQDAAGQDIAFGYKDHTAHAAGAPNHLTALRTYDVNDPHGNAHACNLAYPGIAEHMALCLYRASDINMRANGRAGVSRVTPAVDVAAANTTTVDSKRPRIAIDSGPLGAAAAVPVPYSHAHGQMTLRQWQDWTILQIAHMERVEMMDNRTIEFSIDMANANVATGAAPPAALATGGMWCEASNHTRRNVLMALLYSRTDDELHAQTLFGYNWQDGTAPTCQQVDVAVHYDSRCDRAVVGTDNVYTYADNGIVHANVSGEAIFMRSYGGDAAAIRQELADAKMATFDERAGKTLFVIGKEVTLPLLEFGGKFAVDLRPDTVVPGLYMKGHDELSGEELLEQVPTVQLYEAPDIRTAVREEDNVLRYRHVGDEPDWKDATLLRTQSAGDMIDDTAPVANAPQSSGNLVMTAACIGVHGSTTGGTAAFREQFPLQFPVYPDNFRDRAFPLSGDGTPGSIDRIVARYSYHVRADFARRSFTGMTLPIAILPGVLGPIPALPSGTAVDNRIYFTKCATAGYGEFGLPGPSIDGFTGGCRAVVAELDMHPSIAANQIIRNPRKLVPTAVDLASAMSRRGRHNEVGIAMQSLLSDRQGDIMLHDGV